MFEQRLRQILHPPSSPLEKPVSDDWVAAEAVLGPLPSDFKRFVTQYGTGCIDQFIWVFNPASGNSYLNLTTAGTRQLRAFSDMMGGEFGTTIGVTRIVPFGITDNGDLLAWQVRDLDN